MTPQQIQQERDKLTGEYMFLSEKLADILAGKAIKWLALRDKTTTDKKADLLWDASEEGTQEIRLRLRLKAMDKRLSSLRTHLELMNNEARLNY